MQLEDINKARYNKHIKITFIAICIFMLAVSLAVSTLLIHFWGGPEGENLHWNIAGVVVSSLLLAKILTAYKQHPFLYEVVYIRRVKAELNSIYRKQRQIKEAAAEGDSRAMAILDFNYRASKHVFELDNNTLTLDDLAKNQNELLALQQKFNVEELAAYQPEWLKEY
jgi:lipopolysaccharide export LptBFGC system permease protein LptF